MYPRTCILGEQLPKTCLFSFLNFFFPVLFSSFLAFVNIKVDRYGKKSFLIDRVVCVILKITSVYCGNYLRNITCPSSPWERRTKLTIGFILNCLYSVMHTHCIPCYWHIVKQRSLIWSWSNSKSTQHISKHTKSFCILWWRSHACTHARSHIINIFLRRRLINPSLLTEYNIEIDSMYSTALCWPFTKTSMFSFFKLFYMIF